MCGGGNYGRSFFDYFGGCGGGYGGGCGGGDNYEPQARSNSRHGAGAGRESGRIETEVRAMYASGEISRRQYYDVLEQLDRGLFTWDDLRQMQRSDLGLRRDGQEESPGKREIDPDLQQQSRALEQQKNQLKEEKGRTESVLANLRDSISKLQEQMALDEKMAEGVLTSDEERARSYLRQRQELVEQVAGLEAKFKDLSNDSVQLEQAELRINAKQAELEALAQRERVVRLAGEIKG